jgi:hypothetical protein
MAAQRWRFDSTQNKTDDFWLSVVEHRFVEEQAKIRRTFAVGTLRAKAAG